VLMAAIQYTPGTTIGVSSLVAIAVGVAGVWASFQAGSTKRLLTYALAESTSLLQPAPEFARQDLKVLYRGEVLGEPRILYVRLISRGRQDIERKDFDDGSPLTFDLSARIVAVLGMGIDPSTAAKPELGTDGTKLELWPSLIHKRQTVTIAVLVNGNAPCLTCDGRLANVKIRAQADDDSLRSKRAMMALMAWWLVVIAGLFVWLQWGGGTRQVQWWLTVIFIAGPIAGLNGWVMAKRYVRLAE
jgi:hypothetical protein